MSQMKLMTERRFWPLFWTQFFGAFNDNFFKNALVILITYKAARVGGMGPEQMVALCAGLLILPFFLFSATAGQLADKFPRSILIQWIKLMEVGVMGLASLGFWLNSLPFLLVVLFLMGLQSTLFSPIKYGILPQLLPKEELLGGNALVEMGTFLAILLGTIGGGTLIALEGYGTGVISVGVLVIAFIGLGTGFFVPRLPAEDPSLKIRFNPVTPTWEIYRFTKQNRSVYLSILAVAWFWFMGASVLSLFPNYCKDVLHGNEQLVTFFLALFSIGIGVGSLLCERLSRGRLELGLVPLGSLGMSIFVFDLFLAHPPMAGGPGSLLGVGEFIRCAAGIRIVADLFLLALFSGLYIVPLMALIQQRTEATHRSRVIAGSNILSAFFMVLSSAFLMGLHALGVPIPTIFLLLAVVNLLAVVRIYLAIPEFLYRFIGWVAVNALYRLRITGLEHIPSEGPAVLVCNHVSFIDWLVVGGSCPRPARFVMHAAYWNIPVVRHFFEKGNVIPIASAKEDPAMLEAAFDRIAQELEDGQVVCVFPEGALTRDGAIQEFRTGIERIVARSPAPVIPMAIQGLWGSHFSHAWSRFLGRAFARVQLNIGHPIPPGRATAAHLRQMVAELRGSAR